MQAHPVRHQSGIGLPRILRSGCEILQLVFSFHAVTAGDGVTDKFNPRPVFLQRNDLAVRPDLPDRHYTLCAFAQLPEADLRTPGHTGIKHRNGFLRFLHAVVHHNIPVHQHRVSGRQVCPGRVRSCIVRPQHHFQVSGAGYPEPCLTQGGKHPEHSAVHDGPSQDPDGVMPDLLVHCR